MNTDNFVNITEVWKASGLGSIRAPGEWKNAAETKKDVAALALSLFATENELVISKKGRGATYVHPELLESYYAFLASPLTGPREHGPSKVEVMGDMALIELKNAAGEVVSHTLIDAEDSPLVKDKRWRDRGGYVIGPNGIKLHRVIMRAESGDIVDHINRCPRDNRKANLRLTDAQGNARNRTKQSNNESGVPGVGWHKGGKMWNARITINRKTMSLGYYKTIEEATKARQEAERMYFGKFSPSAKQPTHAPSGSSSQAILTRIIKMQALGFTFVPVPCGENLCANFVHDDWGASGMAYDDDLAAAVFSASKAALRELAARKRAHWKACKEAAAVFTEFDPEKDLL